MSWDTALRDGGQGDWTVCTVWLLLGGVNYLLHMSEVFSSTRNYEEHL